MHINNNRSITRVNHFIIVRLMQRFRQTGNVTDRSRAGRPRKTTLREDRPISRRARQRPFSRAGARPVDPSPYANSPPKWSCDQSNRAWRWRNVNCGRLVRRKLTISERWQAVGMHNGGFSHRRVADHFRVNHFIIARLMQRFRQTGNVTDRSRETVVPKMWLSWNEVFRWRQTLARPSVGRNKKQLSSDQWTRLHMRIVHPNDHVTSQIEHGD
jgi:transposase